MKKEARLISDVQTFVPLLISTTEASRMLALSRSKFYSLCASGQIGPCPLDLGGCRRYRLAELQDWVANGCKPRETWLNCNNKDKSA